MPARGPHLVTTAPSQFGAPPEAPPPSPLPGVRARYAPWGLVVLGLWLLHISHPVLWMQKPPGWSFPPVGLGLVFVAWFGWRGAVAVFLDGLLVAAQAYYFRAPSLYFGGRTAVLGAFWEAFLLAVEVLAVWGYYHGVLGGSRRLGDPRSAMLFLIVTGSLTGIFGFLFSLPPWLLMPAPRPGLMDIVGDFWLAHALGIFAVTPPLLSALTPWMARRRLILPLAPADQDEMDGPRRVSARDVIEVGILSVGLAVLGLLQAIMRLHPELPQWHLWGVSLVVIVWASLRQGLVGGTIVASSSVSLVLLVLGLLRRNVPPDNFWQLNLVGQCGAALLVASAGHWIRLSEARYRQVVTRIPVVLYSARIKRAALDGRTPPLAELTFVSPAARDLLGTEPDELTGEYSRWLIQVHPEDREVLVAALLQLGRQRLPVTCEYRLLPRALPPGPGAGSGLQDDSSLDRLRAAIKETYGSRVISFQATSDRARWVRDTLAPHFGATGELEGWDGVVSDITEQRRLADDLRRTMSMFHALVAHLPAGVFFVQGSEGLPILVNARARQLLGRHEDPAAGLARLVDTYRLCRPDGTPYPTEELPVVAALRHGVTSMRDDIVVHRPDGQRVPLIAWGAPVELGGRRHHEAAVWVFEDLTALKEALEVVRASEERYRLLVESLPTLLIQFDTEGRVTYLNPAAQEVSGYAPADLAAPGTWEALVHDADREAARAAFARARDGETTRVEARYRAKDGRELVGYAIVQPQRQDGATVGVTALIVDMTRERRLEQELQRVQRMELIGRVSSGIAHDFNNLLTVILTLSQLAEQALPEDHPARDDLRKITYAGEQAANLAHQLLAFSKNRHPVPRRVDVNRVARRTLELLRAALPKVIHIDSELADAELPVLADEMQLQQVLMNLCLNARDAMPQGGRLSVRTERVGGAPTDWARISVRDTGQGILPEVQARIFDPFFSTKEHGTGLGLAMVRQIVEGCGGRVEVASTPGAGAQFDVWLPAV